jgi:transglutaminase-like putative cysteine protease
LEIRPNPADLREALDHWGNRVLHAEFQGSTERLDIVVRLDVETLPASRPSIGSTGACPESLPPHYGAATASLTTYLEPPEGRAALEVFTAPLRDASGGNADLYLQALNATVQRFYHQGTRLDGPPQVPADTIASGSGVCRDLALLFVEACRHAGIAARFASGYQKEPGRGHADRRYLHAWAEVYLPEVGWQGYDPTHGTEVTDEHVTVACAADPQDATPVTGSYSFQGERITSTLETEVLIATD